jgi:hypothetical protein
MSSLLLNITNHWQSSLLIIQDFLAVLRMSSSLPNPDDAELMRTSVSWIKKAYNKHMTFDDGLSPLRTQADAELILIPGLIIAIEIAAEIVPLKVREQENLGRSRYRCEISFFDPLSRAMLILALTGATHTAPTPMAAPTTTGSGSFTYGPYSKTGN